QVGPPPERQQRRGWEALPEGARLRRFLEELATGKRQLALVARQREAEFEILVQGAAQHDAVQVLPAGREGFEEHLLAVVGTRGAGGQVRVEGARVDPERAERLPDVQVAQPAGVRGELIGGEGRAALDRFLEEALLPREQ